MHPSSASRALVAALLAGCTGTSAVQVDAGLDAAPAADTGDDAPRPDAADATPTTDTAPALDTAPATDTAPALDTAPATDTAPALDTAPATDTAPRDATVDVAMDAGPAPPGETCADPVVVTGASGVREDTLAGYGDDVRGGASCLASDGPDRVYALDVPAGQMLMVRASPTASASPSFRPVLSFTTACAASGHACLAATTRGELRRWNRGAATERVFVVVDAESAEGGAFYFTHALTTPTPGSSSLPGDTCSFVETFDAPERTGDSTVGFRNDLDGAAAPCGFGAGPDRVYRREILGAARLTITVRPEPGLDLAVTGFGAFASCTATPPVCTASVDAAGPGGAETLTIPNASTATLRVYFVVDGVRPTDAGRYDVEMRVSRL